MLAYRAALMCLKMTLAGWTRYVYSLRLFNYYLLDNKTRLEQISMCCMLYITIQYIANFARCNLLITNGMVYNICRECNKSWLVHANESGSLPKLSSSVVRQASRINHIITWNNVTTSYHSLIVYIYLVLVVWIDNHHLSKLLPFFDNCFWKLLRILVKRIICQHKQIFSGLSMELYIEQDEYVPELADTAGVRLVVHPQTSMPFPEDDGVTIAPGTSTSVSLTLVKIHFQITT